MKFLLSLIFFSAILPCSICQQVSQSFLVEPYLQDAEPHSIKIMWETSLDGESVVQWGKSHKLGNTATGRSFDINFSTSRVHEVQLQDLERFTEYYYRVQTGDLKSDIYQFKTPPFSSDHQSFRMVAMSDMQHDDRNPNKFREVVQQGVLEYLDKEHEGTITESLALVLVPGDLVVEGPIYHQWQDHFFEPAKSLFAHVPVYPVPGNHERNSEFFFKYFSLPENGTPAYAEHWWYKDYGNVRIVGMDSNDGYDQIASQISWLKELMKQTAKDESIDFVFAQMHHPHKSELWLAGESDFTGEVIKVLEAFTTESGKPSIHFFGHTHGYSRGQSRDHKHLWINVATAGGRIDEWGAYAQENYDEFTVTQAEYGFVVVEVEPNQGDPYFTIKRISRGNEKVRKDNVLTDSMTVYKATKKPRKPQILSPLGVQLAYNQVTLMAGDFEGKQPAAYHAGSHWQVADKSDFSSGLRESWKQSSDWYFDRDLQADDDLKDEDFVDVRPNKTFFWRVRYRDQFLNWSDWSEVGTFTTHENPVHTLTQDGAWCWFSDPRAVRSGDQVITGWVRKDGSVEAASLNLSNHKVQKQILFPQMEVDDHNNPAFALLPDQRILCMYAWHGGKRGVVYHTSAKPLDVSSFSEKTVITPGVDELLDKFPRETFTYANPYLLHGEAETIYSFGRWIGYKPNMISSTDFGESWHTPRVIISPEEFDPSNRPYVKYASDNQQRIHLVFTTGHPHVEPYNAVYHCYYEKDAYWRSDGSKICNVDALPFSPEEATLVYQPDATSGRAWLADIAIDEEGQPVLLYTRHPEVTDHRYHYAWYNGLKKQWIDHEICQAGRWFPQTQPGVKQREEHYHGNLTIHPENTGLIYLSRQIDGVFEIEKRTTKDRGLSWKVTPVTSHSKYDQVRPYIPRGSRKTDDTVVLWMENKKYIHYTNYDTRIKYYVDGKK